MARKKAGIKPYLPLPEERAKICEKRKLGENVISAN